MRISLLLCLLVLLSAPFAVHAQPPWEKVILQEPGLAMRASILAGDVNNDGDDDLCFITANSLVNFFHQVPDGLQWGVFQLNDNTLPLDIDLADMDGDGDLDVLVVQAGPVMSIIVNLPGNQWHQVELTPPPGTHNFEVIRGADMDGDGDMDIVYAGNPVFSENRFGWMERVENGYVDHIIEEGGTPVVDMDIDDWNQDGVNDLLLAQDEVGLRLLTQQADGSFIQETQFTFESLMTSRFVDLDGDNDLDLLTEHSWFENVGMGWPAHELLGVTGKLARAGDLDEDGDVDIATTLGLNTLVWFERTPTGFVQQLGSEDFSTYLGMALADLDNDGDQDIAGVGFAGPNVMDPAAVFYFRNNMGDAGPYVEADMTFMGEDFIPPSGGQFHFDVTITNPTAQTLSGQAWTEVTLPNGNVYGPIVQVPLTMTPGQVIQNQEPLVQSVPGFAPAGEYQFRVEIGVHPTAIYADGFPFYKWELGVDDAGGPVSGWSTQGLRAMVDPATVQAEVVPLPAEWTLEAAYPNPFNPSTTITVALPEAAELSLRVYDVQGRQVAELAGGPVSAGTHTFTFDASSLASGVYFIQATVPGELNQVRKVTLMK